MQYYSIILAAGKSLRFCSEKMLYKIDDSSVIYQSVKLFYNDIDCKKIIVVVREDLKKEIQNELKSFNDKIEYVLGGQTRHNSFINGLIYCKKSEYVLIHDGARPFLKQELINRIKKEFEFNSNLDAVIPILDIYDSLIDISNISYLNRENIKIIQTPQAFKTKILFTIKSDNNITYNDEFSWVKDYYSNFKYKFIYGEQENIKLTTPHKK